MTTKANGTAALMEFDSDAVNNLSAIDVAKFISAAKGLQDDALEYVQVVSAIIAKCAVSCPKEWGDPKAPETYQNLPWKTTFQTVTRELSSELNSDTKN